MSVDGAVQDAAILPRSESRPATDRGRFPEPAFGRDSTARKKTGKAAESLDDPDQDRESDDSRGKDKGDSNKNRKENTDDNDGKPKSRLPLIILAIVALVIIIGWLIYWFLTRDLVSTDDAYTEGNAISIAPKVSGYVVERRVDDNTPVKAGDLMIRVDPRDYLTARDQAKANLDLARSQLASAEIDLEIARVRAPAQLKQAQAQLDEARASQINANRQYERQRAVDPRATTQTNVDQANTQLLSNTAQVSSARAQVQIAALVDQNIQSAEDTVTQRSAQVEQAEASLAQDELNLSYTEIRAPHDGRVTRRNVDVGTYAQAGQQIFYLVTPEVWVVANFKETQLTHMRPGQRVSIDVDAYPDLRLHGHVDSIQAGSGARFTTFPAENATGNFVKIVRRVPVKIVIDSGLDPDLPLPPGLSVDPTVTVE